MSFQDLLFGRVVVVFSVNTTAVSYLRRQGGSFSPVLNVVSQWILHWVERKEIIILPQLVSSRNNVVADALSHPNQVIGAEWTLHQEVFDWLQKRWPVTVGLLPSLLNHSCGVYFAPGSDPMAAGTDSMLQSWDSLLACAFLPFALTPQVLVELQSLLGAVLTLITSFWPQREWFLGLLNLPVKLPLPFVSLTFGGSSKTSPCCGFMPGNYQAFRQSLRIFFGSGW